MSNEPRQRKSQGNTEEKLGDEVIGSAVKDPFVRSPPKPFNESNIDDYWDLEDDEDWVDGQNSTNRQTKEDAEQVRKRRVLKRGSVEVGIAFVFHLLAMCVYIYIHVYDATIVKRNKGRGFVGIDTYGGRWKFLTYCNLVRFRHACNHLKLYTNVFLQWLQFMYFFLCFFTDIMPWSSAKYWFLRACDVLFTTIALPLSMFVVILFWGLFFTDRELVFPQELDAFIPSLHNHFCHTVPIIMTFLEAMVVFHQYPSYMVGILVVFIVCTLYIVWIVWVFTITNLWPYPFIKLIPLPVLPVFFTANYVISVLFYLVGKFTSYLRWKERHDLLDEEGL